MSRPIHWMLGSLLLVLIVGGPLGYARYRKENFRNFRTVEAGALYRSGQLSPEGLERIFHDHRIKTVITLRFAPSADDPAPDEAEQKRCRYLQLHYYRLPHQSFLQEKGVAPADRNVARFLAIMDDPAHHPVLIHCFAGKHRTGAFVAIYRMEYCRWSNADAIAELEDMGYDNLDEHWDVRSYLESYVPRWRRERN